MSATLRRRCADIPSAGSRCKGTKKNVYVQEKFAFIAIGYIFFTVASRIKVPSKVQQKMQMCKYSEQYFQK